MIVNIEIGEADLRALIVKEINRQLGDAAEITIADVTIQTKSKQNYKSEWETASFRASITKQN